MNIYIRYLLPLIILRVHLLYPYVYLYLNNAAKDKISDNISANAAINHTPSTPNIGGRTISPIMKNMNVLNNDSIPETTPFEKAVNMPLVNILKPHNKKLIENKLNPFNVI